MILCPVMEKNCPCPEFSKEGLCDYPYKNDKREISFTVLWGQRLPFIKLENEVMN